MCSRKYACDNVPEYGYYLHLVLSCIIGGGGGQDGGGGGSRIRYSIKIFVLIRDSISEISSKFNKFWLFCLIRYSIARIIR